MTGEMTIGMRMISGKLFRTFMEGRKPLRYQKQGGTMKYVGFEVSGGELIRLVEAEV